jgi:hypothetical protein
MDRGEANIPFSLFFGVIGVIAAIIVKRRI